MLVVDEKTVRRWVHDYNVRGPGSFGPDRRGGRRESFLTRDEESSLMKSLSIRAEQGEFVTAEEVRREVQARIHRAVSRSFLRHLLHRHRWRKIVPRPRHPDVDPEEIAAYKQQFSSILSQIVDASPPGLPIRVLFEDEATFGRISEIYSCWAPPHVRPKVGKQQVRQYVHALCAVGPFDGVLVYSLHPRLDHKVVGRFLRRIANRFPGDYCIVFFDRSGPHIDHELQIPPLMRVEHLPAKSPELNPVEHVWDHVREKHFGNKLFPTIDDVTGELRHAFRLLASSPDQVRSMTGFPWIVNRTF